MIKETLEKAINSSLAELGIENPEAALSHPDVLSHGDYATSAALAYAKKIGIAPRALAEKIVVLLESVRSKGGLKEVSKIEIAGPGFINFHLSNDFFAQSLVDIAKMGKKFGTNSHLSGKKILVEYTDPNAFKVLHIGHLMSNAIGESLARLMDASGAETIRVCYPSDIGLHIAKAVWATKRHLNEMPKDTDPIISRTNFLGKMYVEGTTLYETTPEIKKEIETINRAIFEHSDPQVRAIYEKGLSWSYEHFESIYKRLGTRFDKYFYESHVAFSGTELVKANVGKVFTKSDGAIVFKGEEYGLHTRVFINSQGLPTYEAKEMGLNKRKFEELKPDLSVVVTASEQSEYFKVVLKALSLIYPEMAEKSKHVSHGMMRFANGKMSSRTGNVITGESLIADMEEMVMEKMKDRGFDTEAEKVIAEQVAVGAIKYAVLRSSAGSDIIYDPEKSISFEGDSGPYLQYSHVRASSVLAKASKDFFAIERADFIKLSVAQTPGKLEKVLYRFPEVVERSAKEFQPHYIATYLTELASAFNAFYANTQIIDEKNAESTKYHLGVTAAFATVMHNGLDLLGIRVPEKM